VPAETVSALMFQSRVMNKYCTADLLNPAERPESPPHLFWHLEKQIQYQIAEMPEIA
jgi:hypothetical protein